MEAEHIELDPRLRRFQDACGRAGIKLTHQRMVVFQAVAQTDQHPDAETIYEMVRKQVPTISRDTVYRNLWLLRDLGLISTLGPPREKTRFDANTRKHHHFICAACGAARDFYSRELDELPVPHEVKTMGRVETTHVELRGLCTNCLDDERARNVAGRQGGKP